MKILYVTNYGSLGGANHSLCEMALYMKQYYNIEPYILVLQCDSQESEWQAKSYLDTETCRCVVKSKTVLKGSIELNLDVRLKSSDTSFINVLSELPGVRSAVLVRYNGDYMG